VRELRDVTALGTHGAKCPPAGICTGRLVLVLVTVGGRQDGVAASGLLPELE
jgi:hypothetical protein